MERFLLSWISFKFLKMKKITLLFLLFSIGIVSAQEIKWMTMDEALAAQSKTPKKIFVDMYTVW